MIIRILNLESSHISSVIERQTVDNAAEIIQVYSQINTGTVFETILKNLNL